MLAMAIPWLPLGMLAWLGLDIFGKIMEARTTKEAAQQQLTTARKGKREQRAARGMLTEAMERKVEAEERTRPLEALGASDPVLAQVLGLDAASPTADLQQGMELLQGNPVTPAHMGPPSVYRALVS